MSRNSDTVRPKCNNNVAIPFRKRANEKDDFLALFREGMALVEATANYLDGPGRRESKCLPPYAGLAYATESMRLTTRLTQLATWLLARRAVMNGERMPPAGTANDPLLLPPVTRVSGSRGFDQLPPQLKALIEEGYRLHRKICDFDAADRGEIEQSPKKGPNPVATQMAQIHAAFTA